MTTLIKKRLTQSERQRFFVDGDVQALTNYVITKAPQSHATHSVTVSNSAAIRQLEKKFDILEKAKRKKILQINDEKVMIKSSFKSIKDTTGANEDDMTKSFVNQPGFRFKGNGEMKQKSVSFENFPSVSSHSMGELISDSFNNLRHRTAGLSVKILEREIEELKLDKEDIQNSALARKRELEELHLPLTTALKVAYPTKVKSHITTVSSMRRGRARSSTRLQCKGCAPKLKCDSPRSLYQQILKYHNERWTRVPSATFLADRKILCKSPNSKLPNICQITSDPYISKHISSSKSLKSRKSITSKTKPVINQPREEIQEAHDPHYHHSDSSEHLIKVVEFDEHLSYKDPDLHYGSVYDTLHRKVVSDKEPDLHDGSVYDILHRKVTKEQQETNKKLKAFFEKLPDIAPYIKTWTTSLGKTINWYKSHHHSTTDPEPEDIDDHKLRTWSQYHAVIQDLPDDYDDNHDMPKNSFVIDHDIMEELKKCAYLRDTRTSNIPADDDIINVFSLLHAKNAKI